MPLLRHGGSKFTSTSESASERLDPGRVGLTRQDEQKLRAVRGLHDEPIWCKGLRRVKAANVMRWPAQLNNARRGDEAEKEAAD